MLEFKFIEKNDTVYFFARNPRNKFQKYEDWVEGLENVKKDSTQSKERLIDMAKLKRVLPSVGIESLFNAEIYMSDKYIFMDIRKGENFLDPVKTKGVLGDVVECAETSTNIYVIYNRE